MTTFKPTEEQAVALAHATAGRSLRIEARAGAGKTSTLYRNARSTAEAWRDLRSAAAPLAHGTPSP